MSKSCEHCGEYGHQAPVNCWRYAEDSQADALLQGGARMVDIGRDGRDRVLRAAYDDGSTKVVKVTPPPSR